MITKFSFCTVSIIAKGLVKDYSDHQVIIFTTSEFVDPRRLGMYSRHRVYYYDTEDKVIVNTKLVGGYFFADLKIQFILNMKRIKDMISLRMIGSLEKLLNLIL